MEYMTFQGDVDLREIEKIPESAKLLDTKTVMYGEATGHHHTFTNGQVLVYEPAQKETIKVRNGEHVAVAKYIHVLQDATLTHQEHAPQLVPAGKYAILQEREFDPLEQQIRRVSD